MSERIDFRPATVRALAQRSAYMCNRCRRLTIAPDSTPDGILMTGIAAHICAASPGGPRADATLTDNQVRSIDNGIWLCTECSKIVDSDVGQFPVEDLHRIKREHEDWVRGGSTVPPPPRLKISPNPGVPLPPYGASHLRGGVPHPHRYFNVTITGTSSRETHELQVRVQLPHAIEAAYVMHRQAGTEVVIKPDQPRGMGWWVDGDCEAVMPTARRSVPAIQIGIEHLRARSSVEIGIRTDAALRHLHFPGLEEGEFIVPFHFVVSYQYEDRGHFFPREMIYEIDVSPEGEYTVEGPLEEGGNFKFPKDFCMLPPNWESTGGPSPT